MSSSTTTTTPPGLQTSGPRTVLSPIGLNVRAQPVKTAAVLGTAAQGAVLAVLGHTAASGGWFQVKGATATGWISDNPALSAPGTFAGYVSSTGQFDALYPQGWKVVESPPTTVTFSAPSGDETVVVTTAAKVGQLGRGRPGFVLNTSEQILICGATSYLDIYGPPGSPATTAPAAVGTTPGKYLVQARLTINAQHALGIDANLADLSQLQSVRNFVNSVSFAFPPCEG
ncbi:MAG TPA: SH3 domain-containing protein [Acidimicrobiales bacterium]|nr:SH3 domain-containing protein [Acidimicrobiales bacterium]